MFTAPLDSIQAAYEAKLVSLCVLYVDNVVRQVSKLIDEPLTVDLVENPTSIVIPMHE